MRSWYIRLVCTLAAMGLFSPTVRASAEEPPLILTLRPVKAQFMVGEPLHLYVKVTSPVRHGSEFSFATRESTNQWIGFETVVAATGRVIGSYDPVRQRGGPRGLYKTGPDAFRTEVIAHRSVMPRKAGRYQMTAWTLVNFRTADGKHLSRTIRGECSIEIIPGRRRILMERAQGIHREFEARRAETVANARQRGGKIPYGLRDWRDLTVDYLLADPAEIGLPALEKLAADTGRGWHVPIAERLDDYPPSVEAVRILIRLYQSEGSEYVQPHVPRTVYRMYYESAPDERARIERIVGDPLARQLRRQFTEGRRPVVVEDLD
jgi:hypothetical protein